MPKEVTLRDAITAIARSFRSTGIESPALDAKLIVLGICNLSQEAFILNPARRVGRDEAETIERAVVRRLQGEPVSRILGKREFWGLDYAIGPSVLDPRPDTETLVEAALDILSAEQLRDTPLKIADLGTGSGCILLSLLSELPNAWGLGVDIDPDSLSVARENARRLGLASRTAFLASDWAESLSGDFDMIVTNPPYIETETIASLSADVRLFDPFKALDGGTDGFGAYRQLAQGCKNILRKDGWILLEAGVGQAEGIVKIFVDAGWGKTAGPSAIYNDLNCVKRVVAIKRQT
jgi:release factor glutamine methyltransferase